MQAEAELPVTAVPESPEANENNPFLSGLQQSGISMTTGKTQSLCSLVANIFYINFGTWQACIPEIGSGTLKSGHCSLQGFCSLHALKASTP